MARRKLFGAALSAWRKARGGRRSSPRTRTVTKYRTRTRVVRVRGRSSSSGGGFKPLDAVLKGAFVAGGVMLGAKVADRVSGLSPMGRAAVTFGAGAAVALLAQPVARMARRLPIAGRFITPGALGLTGLGLMGDGVRRGFEAAGGFGALRRFAPRLTAPATPPPGPALPSSGTVAAGPRYGRDRYALATRGISR